jgi:PleD family two-component response regulator
MIAERCASELSMDPVPGTDGANALTCTHEGTSAPVTDWRGFHSELRRAAVAATQTGAPLSLLMLELAGPMRIARQAGAGVVAERIRVLAGLIRSAIGERGALARYAEERLALIMMETDLGGAVAGAERIGQSLACPGGGGAGRIGLRVPAIGVAQFHDDESLGDLIQRAAGALGRARSERALVVVADRGVRQRPGRARCDAGERACVCGLCGP